MAKTKVSKSKEKEAKVESKKEVKSKSACESCGHGDKLHYGSDKKWCNHQGCQCQALS